MTTPEIEAFLTIIKAGSISAAAEKLYVTQPALSRRITALEKKIGYALFLRGKGIRTIELTPEGKAFLPIAEKLMGIWKDTQEIGNLKDMKSLSLSAIGSVITYLLPNVFKTFMATYPECALDIHNYHSFESYQYVESGEIDLAFIANPFHSTDVKTTPAFMESMHLITSLNLEEPVSPEHLDPSGEIRLPWNPEYDQWHDFWFKPYAKSRVKLDQITLIDKFLDDPHTWVIAPTYIADRLLTNPQLHTYKMVDPPHDILIYHLTKKSNHNPYSDLFLEVLKDELEGLQGIQSYL